MTEDISDRQFAERALAQLPADRPSPRLEAALLAAYDAWQAERARGPWAAFKAALRNFGQTVWPGAPAWAPAAALAASLVVGAMLGASLSAVNEAEPQGFSLEHTQNFSLAADAMQEDL
jgi:hypothetical protein